MATPDVNYLSQHGLLRLSGHAELYKKDEETGELVLISTTRPCEVCGNPLEGLVIPKWEARAEGQEFVHSDCRNKLVKGVSLA